MPLKWKKDIEPKSSDDFWYDVSLGGYIDPYEFLEEDDADKVFNAINILKQFKEEGEQNGLIESF